MASHSIAFKPSVYKDLKELTKADISRILVRVEALGKDPFPPQSIKLSGSQRLYRIRAGDYRIIYEVNSNNRSILVHYIRHRRDVYRNL